MQYELPENTTISANGYLMVWADKDEEQEGLHANFKLSAAAESIILSDTNGSIIDEVSFIDQDTGVSFGRFPNGTGNFRQMTPTFGAENNGDVLSVGDVIENAKLSLFPNPTNSGFWISYQDIDEVQLTVTDLHGCTILSQTITHQHWIDTQNWVSGIYLVRVNDSVGKILVR